MIPHHYLRALGFRVRGERLRIVAGSKFLPASMLRFLLSPLSYVIPELGARSIAFKNNELIPIKMTTPQDYLIERKDWDLLIILDACRYDIFRTVYDTLLIRESTFYGILKKTVSPGSATLEWLYRTFLRSTSFKDRVYVSANPYINSKIPVQGFNAR